MKRNSLNRSGTVGMTDHLECPICHRFDVSTTFVDDPFTYGVGEDAVQLTVTVPLRTCGHCGYQFLDDAAEDLRQEAVCRHLGVLTPAEIVALRDRYDLSRAEFARITRFGEATLGRWERGALVQNAANDQLLYLLTFPENLRRLRERFGSETGHPPVPSAPQAPKERPAFTRVFREEQRRAGARFNPRLCLQQPALN